MRSSLWPLQKALFQRLSTDTALSARITGVYDEVPEDATVPYVTLGEDTAIPWDTKDMDGQEVTTTLHCWSQYPGKKEAKEILSLMVEALTQSPLQLESGFSMSFDRLESMQVISDPDGVTKHGVLRMRFNTKG